MNCADGSRVLTKKWRWRGVRVDRCRLATSDCVEIGEHVSSRKQKKPLSDCSYRVACDFRC